MHQHLNSSAASKLRLAQAGSDLAVAHGYVAGAQCDRELDECYIDLLRPFNAFSEFALDHECGDNLDVVLAARKVNRTMQMCGPNTVTDDVFVLYVSGDETMLDSMEEMVTGIKTPWTIKEALKTRERDAWIKSIHEEMDALFRHKTWTVVRRDSLPAGTSIVSSKIAFRVKLDSDNKPKRFKSRLVARGFSQEYGKNFTETFQPVEDRENACHVFRLSF